MEHYQYCTVEYEGRMIPLKDIPLYTGLNYNTVINRYKRGDRGLRLLRPAQKSGQHTTDDHPIVTKGDWTYYTEDELYDLWHRYTSVGRAVADQLEFLRGFLGAGKGETALVVETLHRFKRRRRKELSNE